MIVTIDNLQAGLQVWAEDKLPKDLHNAEYYDMYNIRSAGVTAHWWSATVDRLAQWIATRPVSKAVIAARGLARLSAVAAQYAKLKPSPTTEPSIVDTNWEDVAPLYALASEIKQPYPPVFASKMCHFLFPKLFIVMDNKRTDPFEYEFYWRGMKDEWRRFNEKADILSESIKSDKTIHDWYPWETKIMELSHMGWKSRRQQR